MRPRTSRELFLAAGVLFAAFIGLTLYVRHVGRIPGDARLLSWARGRGEVADTLGDFESLYAALGTRGVGAATVVAITALVARAMGGRYAALVVGAALVVLLEPPVVELVGTTDASKELLFPPEGYPSGHVLYATAVFGIAAILTRGELRGLAVLGLLGMGATRVSAGSHLLDEVVGAYLLGAAWLCLVLAAFRRHASKTASVCERSSGIRASRR